MSILVHDIFDGGCIREGRAMELIKLRGQIAQNRAHQCANGLHGMVGWNPLLRPEAPGDVIALAIATVHAPFSPFFRVAWAIDRSRAFFARPQPHTQAPMV